MYKKYKIILILVSVLFGFNLQAQTKSACFTSSYISNNRIDYNTIIPCGAKKITLTYNYFKIDAGSVFKVYDGQNAAGKPLHPGSGFTSTNPPTNPIVAYSGALYLYFSKNGTGKDSMAACWTAEIDTLKPIAKFEIADTIYNGVKNTFINKSQHTHPQTDYLWEIEPGYGEVGYSKDLNYTLYTNKTYDISLTATTCIGWHKFTKSVVVITPNYQVALDFKAKKLKPFIHEIDTFSAIHFTNFKRPNKADVFHWNFSPDSVTYLNGTTLDSPIIYVKFKGIGKYTVSLEAFYTVSPLLSYNKIIKKEYITVLEPPRPKVYLDIKCKNKNPMVGNIDTFYAIDSISGKLFKADQFWWDFLPNNVSYENGTSPNMKTIQVKFKLKGKYSVHLRGWNSADSALTVNDTFKVNFINSDYPPFKMDFKAQNTNPKLGQIDTLYAIDSVFGNPVKANRFSWKFSPNKVNYVNGTSSDMKIIQVKFKEIGKYTVSLKGWNATDSIGSISETIKYEYLTVEEHPWTKVKVDFEATNLSPEVSQVDTFYGINLGLDEKANRFNWEFYPDKVTYVNGTTSDMQNIQIKFNEKGLYTVLFKGWNWVDSLATANDTIKINYIEVKESTIGIKNIYSSDVIAIYPNPSSGTVNIKALEPIQIEVYDVLNKLTKRIECSDGIQVIDFSNDPNGIYTFKIFTKDLKIIKRISIIK